MLFWFKQCTSCRYLLAAVICRLQCDYRNRQQRGTHPFIERGCAFAWNNLHDIGDIFTIASFAAQRGAKNIALEESADNGDADVMERERILITVSNEKQ